MSSSARLQFVRTNILELPFEASTIAPSQGDDAVAENPPLLAFARAPGRHSTEDQRDGAESLGLAQPNADLRQRVEAAEMKTRLVEARLRALNARLALDALRTKATIPADRPINFDASRAP